MSKYSFFNLNPYKNSIYKEFYDQLFDDLDSYYIDLGFPENCGLVYLKPIYMPWNFIDILNTHSMKASLGKIQTAHSYKLNDRMCDSRFEHMCFTYMLGVDLLIILDKNGYKIDAKTKVAFLLKLLLHDNGHGPFSHPFEEMVDGYKGMHEDIGKRNIEEDQELHNCLEKIYPGLSTYVANFNELEPYGLHELAEGIFDLDRCAFLIIDTWLSNSKLYPENDSESLRKLIDSIYFIFENIILKNGHIYYNPKCFQEIQFFLQKRFYNYKNLYQEKGRVLDDLLLHELGVELLKTQSSTSFLEDILRYVEEFKSFLKEIKEKKAQVNLKKYYEYIDIDLERIASLSKLYDFPKLSYYARLFSSPYHYMVESFDIESLSKEEYDSRTKNNPNLLHTINKIGVYKSTPEEHIVFYNPETEEYTDFKDMKERTLDIDPFIEHYIYRPKTGQRLENELMLREYFIDYFYKNCKNVLINCQIDLSNTKNKEMRLTIQKLISVLEHIISGKSLIDYAKSKRISFNQVLTLLSFYTYDTLWHDYAIFSTLSGEELGVYFKEFAFESIEDANEYVKRIQEILKFSKSLNDFKSFDPEDVVKQLCVKINNIVFVNQAILKSLDIDPETRKSIESLTCKADKHSLEKKYLV